MHLLRPYGKTALKAQFLQTGAATSGREPLPRVRAELQPGGERRPRLHAHIQPRELSLRPLHHPKGISPIHMSPGPPFDDLDETHKLAREEGTLSWNTTK